MKSCQLQISNNFEKYKLLNYFFSEGQLQKLFISSYKSFNLFDIYLDLN
jgi:hypothetical protein